jgi:hypothetical protein
MNYKSFGTAFVVLALAACSSQPTEPTGNAPAPAASAAVAAPPAPALARSADAKPNAGDEKPAINRTLISAGYKPTTIKGQTFYCRTEMITNSAFKKKVCLNETQIQQEERRIRQMQDDLLRSQTNGRCAGPAC